MTTQTIQAVTRSHGRIIVEWDTLGNADDGTPFEPPVGYYLESMQFIGTIGGATLIAQGSNNAQTTWATLKSETSLGFAVPAGQALAFRPATTGGTGTDVDVFAYFSARF